MNYPQGSTWKKWDLHVHSAITALNNHYEGSNIAEKWQKFFEKLNSLNDVAVIGITDYFSVEGYKYVRDNYPYKNIDLFLPNVELRIVPVTRTETPINLHLIFNPAVVDDLDNKLFSNLEFSYSGETYKCLKGSLINLGRKYSNNNLLEEEVAYKVGIEQFKTDIQSLRAALTKNKDIRENTIVVISNSNRDGNSGIQHSSLASTREELYRFSNCIFSSNPSDSLYFLGLGVDNAAELERKYGGIKPCIHGSDAHSLDGILNPCTKRSEVSHNCVTNNADCDKRFCWIKADTTFEGLKQIIFEPSERVKIQEKSPDEDKKKIYIDSVELNGSVNFVVPDSKIQLNRNLVSIIGGRGSGKSALLELIAFLNEEHTKSDVNNKPKIIEYYRNNCDFSVPQPGFTLKICVTDKNNKEIEYTKVLESQEIKALPILYIGQEQLASIATNDEILTKKVCELVNLNFEELEKNSIVEKARKILSEINILREEIFDIQRSYPEYSYKESFEMWLQGLIKRKLEQRKTLSSAETKKVLDDIASRVKRIIELNDFYNELYRVNEAIDNLEINRHIDQINKLQKALYKDKSQEIPKIKIEDQKKVIATLFKEFEKETEALGKDIEESKKQLLEKGIKEDSTVLVQAIEKLQREINIAIKSLQTYQEKLKLLKQKVEERNRLYEDIVKYYQDNVESIKNHFSSFISSRNTATHEERELFSQIMDGVNVEGYVYFDEIRFCDYLLRECFDKRKIKNAEDIKELIVGKEKNGNLKSITLDALKKWINEDLLRFIKGDYFNEDEVGKSKFIEYIFVGWKDYIKSIATVKLNGIPTKKLSVGQRGTLLLKIYLATSSVKQIFVIDQPEDNLDNNFIVNQLVPLIMKIKKDRQIIMTTHNANLVVNTDSEQIIVASLDNHSDRNYISGGIENPQINACIKNTLEGGEAAIKRRMQKYQLKSS